MRLGDIAKIQTGILAKPVTAGEIVYLQAKHFDENGRVQSILAPDLEAADSLQKHLLKPDDILFAAKGSKNFAACYEDEAYPAVASTSFFVIRLEKGVILPKFLAWFLNYPKTQRVLKASAIGTAMVSISKSVLQELEVPTPMMEQQQLILHIYALQSRERELKRQIQILRDKKTQHTIEHLICNPQQKI
jgi:restriction endonuclease S subunit